VAAKSRLLFAAAVAAAALSPGLAIAADPPDTIVTAGPKGLVHDADAAFSFASNDPAAEFECRLDGGMWTPRPAPSGGGQRHVFDESWRPCASPALYPHMEGGPHRFEVRAVSAGGLRDPIPAAREFEIDTSVAAYVQAKRVQRQSEDRIRINLRLSAAEPAEAEIGGAIAFEASRGAPARRFELVSLTTHLSAGERRRLHLVPGAGQRRILRALRNGRRGRARLAVRFTNEHENSSAYRVPVSIARSGGA
jgi:hypothetical protein